MSKIKVLFGLVLALAISACTDFVDPAIPYSDFNTGVYLRTLSVTPNFNFFALSSSKFTVMVEAVDVEDGKTVEKVDVLVRRRRGQGLTNEVQVKSVPASEFKPHTVIDPLVHQSTGSPYPAATIEVTVPEALQAMGLTAADITGGDFFEFRLILTDKQGRTYTNTNLSPDISGGQYYRSPFFYRIPVVCPSDLGGTFAFSSTNMMSVFGSCPGTITGSVTFTPVSPGSPSYTVSDATFGFWDCYGDVFTGTGVRLNDACGQLSFSGTDKYGDSYTFNFISNDGTSLVFRWVNTSNEEGTVTLTANPGKPWPAGLR